MTWQAVESISTLVGALFAAVAAIIAFGLYRTEKTRDRERETRQHQEQAEKVAAWATEAGMIAVLNGSTLPVYDVRVIITTAPHEATIDALALDVLPPSPQCTTLPAPQGAIQKYFDQTGSRRDFRFNPGIEVDFVDSAGRGWRRSADGELVASGPGRRSTGPCRML